MKEATTLPRGVDSRAFAPRGKKTSRYSFFLVAMTQADHRKWFWTLLVTNDHRVSGSRNECPPSSLSAQGICCKMSATLIEAVWLWSCDSMIWIVSGINPLGAQWSRIISACIYFAKYVSLSEENSRNAIVSHSEHSSTRIANVDQVQALGLESRQLRWKIQVHTMMFSHWSGHKADVCVRVELTARVSGLLEKKRLSLQKQIVFRSVPFWAECNHMYDLPFRFHVDEQNRFWLTSFPQIQFQFQPFDFLHAFDTTTKISSEHQTKITFSAKSNVWALWHSKGPL